MFATYRTLIHRTWAMTGLGFKYTRKVTCPWTKHRTYKHRRGCVYVRGEDCFCIACMHGFLNRPSTKDGYVESPDPRVLEEIGNALYPPPYGFRLMPDHQIVDYLKYESLMEARAH